MNAKEDAAPLQSDRPCFGLGKASRRTASQLQHLLALQLVDSDEARLPTDFCASSALCNALKFGVGLPSWPCKAEL